jgi:hypothetical protein
MESLSEGDKGKKTIGHPDEDFSRRRRSSPFLKIKGTVGDA